MAEHVSTQLNDSDSSNKGSNVFKRFGKKLIYSKHMLWGIGLASFLEAIIVPIPLETILIPLMQARRKQLFLIAFIALSACIVAAGVGYAAGYFLFDAIGDQIIELVSTQEQFDDIKRKMEANGFWFVFSVGVTPVPFQVAMLAAGATQFSFLAFMVATALSRSIRYIGLALLVYYTGNKAEDIFHKHKYTATILMLTIIAVAWGVAIFG